LALLEQPLNDTLQAELDAQPKHEPKAEKPKQENKAKAKKSKKQEPMPGISIPESQEEAEKSKEV